MGASDEPPRAADAVRALGPIEPFARAYRSESAVYGVILVSALIAVHGEDDSDLEVLLFTVGTVGVLWVAHVFAGAVAREHERRATFRGVMRALRAAAADSVGLLVAMIVPTLLLLTGVLGILGEDLAYDLALWAGVAVLAIIGFTGAAHRGRPWWARLLAAAVTASLGLIVMLLSAIVH
ncbi:hypothetical protein [Agromyces archimandritae]|uniref:VIT family protein n=1 Tax=Agromyces archimandritae TaxID=2781962 RepID=A0A975IPN8_9MICO|nr:hypothetical protein [Agromyces archimandritae]QTX05828.1 hypothetical protein G127AT_06410 [Agromyces archimandritae]